MNRLSQYRVLLAGMLSPLLALVFYTVVYVTLTKASTDREKDWLFRLSLSVLAMMLPIFFTIALAFKDHRRQMLFLSGKIGLVFAILSLGLAWKPVTDGITRAKQSRNLAMQDVPAPAFDTVDILGQRQRLEDQHGKVVLVNIWATWCEPCQAEMPKLQRLYQDRKDQGFIVFGLSDEDNDLQRKFAEQLGVNYPLLTLKGSVPNLYRDIARYPAIFLIDRQGRLQPAPGPDQPFEKTEATVAALLNRTSN